MRKIKAHPQLIHELFQRLYTLHGAGEKFMEERQFIYVPFDRVRFYAMASSGRFEAFMDLLKEIRDGNI